MIELMPGDERRLALEMDDVTMALLVSVMFPPQGGGPSHWTDLAMDEDVEVEGVMYSPNSALLGVKPPAGSGDLDRHTMDLTFVDPPEPGPTLLDRFTVGGYTGIRMSLQVIFVLDSGSLTRPLHVYRGRCVQVTSPFDEERGRLLVASFSGPLARVDQDASILTSHAQQQRRRAGDTSMAYAHVARDIPWGREIGGNSAARGGVGETTRQPGPNR